MKFTKKFSLSAVLTMALTMPGCCDTAPTQSNNDTTKTETRKNITYPDLIIKTDTIHVTDEKFDEFLKSPAAAFIPSKHTICMHHFEYDDSTSERTQNCCDANNQAARLIFRHEMEHARKVHLTHNTDELSAWDKARMIIMNEIMACASEIIESQEYRRETGERFPRNRVSIWRADSAIMARHESSTGPLTNIIPVDFTDPVIADITLECAFDKFAHAHNRGFYVKRIQNALTNNKEEYVPHNQLARGILFCTPQLNHWDGLFTYEVTNIFHTKSDVNIWGAATPISRIHVLNGVDSIVRADMQAGQIPITHIFEKTR